MRVVRDGGAHRLEASGEEVALANRFLEHLSTLAFSAATVRTDDVCLSSRKLRPTRELYRSTKAILRHICPFRRLRRSSLL
jgi:hypothetical protein